MVNCCFIRITRCLCLHNLRKFESRILVHTCRHAKCRYFFRNILFLCNRYVLNHCSLSLVYYFLRGFLRYCLMNIKYSFNACHFNFGRLTWQFEKVKQTKLCNLSTFYINFSQSWSEASIK